MILNPLPNLLILHSDILGFFTSIYSCVSIVVDIFVILILIVVILTIHPFLCITEGIDQCLITRHGEKQLNKRYTV